MSRSNCSVSARRSLAILSTLVSVALAGCVGTPGEEGPAVAADSDLKASIATGGNKTANSTAGIALDETGTVFQARVAGHVAPATPQTSVWNNGTISPAIHAIRYDVPVFGGCCITLFYVQGSMKSVSDGIVKDVPMEITITTTWENTAANAADLYPVVLFPQYCDETQYASWYETDGPVASAGKKTRTYTFAYVVRSGVEEQDFCGADGYKVGLTVTNNAITTGVAFSQEVRFNYRPDTLTEFTPYAVSVPENVTGFTIKYVGSVKDPTVFLKVFDPEDKLVTYFYDKTNLFAKFPAAGIEIATPEPGEYVVFLEDVNGPRFGLLAIESESPGLTVRQLASSFEMQMIPMDTNDPKDVGLPTAGLLDVFAWWTEMPGETAPMGGTVGVQYFLSSSKGDYRAFGMDAVTTCDPVGVSCGPAYLGGRSQFAPDAFVNKGPYKVRAEGATRANVELMVSAMSYVR